MISRNVNPADKEAGVRAYYGWVRPCHGCGKPTNLMFKTDQGKVVLACSQECANAQK